MTTVTRIFEWDAGHRVLGHEGKCKHLHGHRYVAEVTVAAPELDALGRVVDFGVLKEVVGRWVDEHWDHSLLLHPADPLWRAAVWDPEVIQGKQPFAMPSDRPNPTAENIAAVLCGVAAGLLPPELTVVKVRVWETPNCFADFEPSPADAR